MNVRKGIVRLLTVWLIVWALVGYFGWVAYDNAQKAWLTQLPKDARAITDPFYRSLAKTFYDNSNWGLHLMALAIWLGLVLPIGVAIVFAVGKWIYKGFRPSPGSSREEGSRE